MSIQEFPAVPAQLPFGETFHAGTSTVFKRFGSFAKAAAVPALLSFVIVVADFSFIALSVTGTVVFDEDNLVLSLLQMVTGLLALLPLTLLGITITRQNHLGPQPGWLPSPLLGRRTWSYFGYLLLLSLVLVVLAVAGGFAVIVFMQALAEEVGVGIFVAAGIAGFLLLLYLMLRVSLVLPATALDQKLGIFGSWRLTRRCGLKLLGVFLLLLLVQVLAVMIGSLFAGGPIRIGTPELIIPADPAMSADWVAIALANLPANLWNLAANILIFAMASGALASAYVHLSGWNAPRQDILERFE